MAREKGISAANYWKRFRDILDLQAPNDLKGRETYSRDCGNS